MPGKRRPPQLPGRRMPGNYRLAPSEYARRNARRDWYSAHLREAADLRNQMRSGSTRGLPAEERVEVLKLAALLRLSEALDQDNLQRIERVRVELCENKLHIHGVTRSGDREGFSSIAHAFAGKLDLFAEVFGVEPTLGDVLARQGRRTGGA